MKRTVMGIDELAALDTEGKRVCIRIAGDGHTYAIEVEKDQEEGA